VLGKLEKNICAEFGNMQK